MAERLSSDTIDALGRSLARVLGPIARLLVKQASHEATNVDMLLHHADAADQDRGRGRPPSGRRRRAGAARRQGLQIAQMEAVISQAEIRAVTEVLLPLIGPVAPMLVARQAETSVGRDDFYRRLSDFIPNDGTVRAFLKIRGKLQ